MNAKFARSPLTNDKNKFFTRTANNSELLKQMHLARMNNEKFQYCRKGKDKKKKEGKITGINNKIKHLIRSSPPDI